MERRTIAILLILLVAGIILRSTLLLNAGFYEPDVYFHYAVMLHAIADNYKIPLYFSETAGVPVTEPNGLYYLTLVPYYFISNYVSLYNFLRVIPLFYFVILFIAFYYLTGYVSKKQEFRLLAVFFLVFSPANMTRLIATEYRGDAFVGIFLVISLLIFLRAYNKNKPTLVLLSVFFLSIANLVWNGAFFAYAVYFLSVVLLLGYDFYNKNRKGLAFLVLTSFALFAYPLLLKIYWNSGLIIQQSPSVLIYSLATALLLIVSYAAFRLSRILDAEQRKKALIVVAALVVLVPLPFAITYQWTNIYNYFQQYGGYSTAYLTISELGPPTVSTILDGFGGISVFTPAFWPVLLTVFLPLEFKFLIGIMLFIPLFLYLISKVDGEFKAGMLVAFAYFAVAAFLSAYAIRFIALLSIPAAILMAYSVYWGLVNFKKVRMARILIYVLIIASVSLSIEYAVFLGAVPATSPQFLQAMDWLRTNTPINATIITYWTDGSVVVGWANRTATQTSVTNQGTSNRYPIWLLSSDTSIVPIEKSGNYLLVRYVMTEESSICIDALIYNCTKLSNLTSQSFKNTNLYKLLHTNNTFKGLELVYANNDSKIYEIKA